MASVVLAAAYFATTWLGRHVKREDLADHLTALSQRLGKEPQFAYYAIADGLKRVFSRAGKWCLKILVPEPKPDVDPLLQYFPAFREFFASDTC